MIQMISNYHPVMGKILQIIISQKLFTDLILIDLYINLNIFCFIQNAV